jgi:hypothetical protein
MQGRIEELAGQMHRRRQNPEERDDYEAMIRVGNFDAIRQAKACRLLAEGQAALDERLRQTVRKLFCEERTPKIPTRSSDFTSGV